MPRVIREYLRSFDLKDRVASLRAYARLRRVPRWLPFRSAFARAMTKKGEHWKLSVPAPHLLQHEPDSPPENGDGDLSALLGLESAGANRVDGEREFSEEASLCSRTSQPDGTVLRFPSGNEGSDPD
jgi:hypothetical protein